MSYKKLPNGKTPEEAAHELAITLLSSGYFDTSNKTPEEVFKLVDNTEQIFSNLYEMKQKELENISSKEREELYRNTSC